MKLKFQVGFHSTSTSLYIWTTIYHRVVLFSIRSHKIVCTNRYRICQFHTALSDTSSLWIENPLQMKYYYIFSTKTKTNIFLLLNNL